MCQRIRIAVIVMFFATVNSVNASSVLAVQDSVDTKQSMTIHRYEAYLDLLSDWLYNSSPYIDSLSSPSPYYFKLLSSEVLFEEPIREAIKIEWSPRNISRREQTPFLSGLRDVTLELNRSINQVLAFSYINRPLQVAHLQRELRRELDVPKVKTPSRQELKVAEKTPKVDLGLPDMGDVRIVAKKPNFWRFKGYYHLKFSQFHYSDNWYKGGENLNQLFARADMELNYNNKQKIQFNNKLEMWLGFQTNPNDEYHKFRTSSDLLRMTNTLGLRAIKNWNYTIMSQASTQFYPGYRNNDPKVYSDFMSPLNLVISLGMEYKLNKEKINVTASFSPIAYNFKYIDRVSLGVLHGFKKGKSIYNHFGPSVNIRSEWKITNSFSWSTRLYWFSNLERTQIEWENRFNFKLTKYFSAELFLFPRIDDSSPNWRNSKGRYLMFHQLFNFGFEYSI